MPSGLQRLSEELRALRGDSYVPWLRPGIARLGRDRFFRFHGLFCLAMATACFVAAAGWELSVSYRDGYSFVALGLLTATVLTIAGRREKSSNERLLHFGVAAAFALWAFAEALETAVWDGAIDIQPLSLDGVYVGFYALLALAADATPRWRLAVGGETLRYLRNLEWLVFFCGLLLYFVVVPARVDQAGDLAGVPSSILYLWLDALLLVWFTWQGRKASGPRERFRIILLQATATLLAFSDGLDLWVLSERTEPFPVQYDPLWYLPFLFVVAAVRVGPAESETGGAARADVETRAIAPHANIGWGLAALLPLGHLVNELMVGLSPASAAYQRLSAALATMTLIGLAMLHQRRLARLQRQLLDEIEGVRARAISSSRLEAIGALAGGVAHDFRHLVEQLGRRATAFARRDLDAASRRDLDGLTRATARAEALIGELLAVGQREPPRRRAIDLRAWLGEYTATLVDLGGAGVTAQIDAGAEPVWCDVDPVQLERVVANLVTNARDAMPDGGRLEIRLERRSTSGVNAKRQPGELAVITIRDYGAGMDAATREQLFEPFFTTKTARVGHGLGLATALGLVRAHGGEIAVESAPGEGSTFEVRLPLEGAARRGDDQSPR